MAVIIYTACINSLEFTVESSIKQEKSCVKITTEISNLKKSSTNLFILNEKYSQPTCQLCLQLGYCHEIDCFNSIENIEKQTVISVNDDELKYLESYSTLKISKNSTKIDDIKEELNQNEERLQYLSNLILNK